MFLLATALFLGFLHGLGADHLMAIAALSVDGRVMSPAARRARALGVAVRFAIGHALLLAVGAGLIVLIGWSIPEAVERGGERLGGVLLVVMGGIGLWGLASGRVYGHTHVHGHQIAAITSHQSPVTSHQSPVTSHQSPVTSHQSRAAGLESGPATGDSRLATDPHAHWHVHVGPRDLHPASTTHSHVPTMIGAAFAISSLRALAMLTPFGAGLGVAPLPVLLALIVVFAAGILMSMSLFGVALARVLSTDTLHRVGRGAGVLVGAASVVLGVAWIVTA